MFVTIGPLLAAIALLWLSRIHVQSTYGGAVLGPLLVLALGLGFSFVPLVLGATSGVQPADMGVASAVLNTAQQVGGTLGLAVLVTVAAAATRSALQFRRCTPGCTAGKDSDAHLDRSRIQRRVRGRGGHGVRGISRRAGGDPQPGARRTVVNRLRRSVHEVRVVEVS